MSRMIFINLPVANLDRAMAFYSALGFVNEPRFTDETGAAMQWSESIVVMLVTHAKWRTFTDRPLNASGSSEVALALNVESRAAVDAMIHAGVRGGGHADGNSPQDHGFMYQRAIADPDDHIWEPFWMNPAVAKGEAHVSEATA